ncbi:Hypothetical_protein [Hexamita inflata]|uniref:Hypothetical_protein n=1 Tax=Hexamita inflata TaxID=28002 RepID=A0AA86PR00_9EUKA|nr:Hypothetical protein HINF_LOCUS30761 [Hexamita inflata]
MIQFEVKCIVVSESSIYFVYFILLFRLQNSTVLMPSDKFTIIFLVFNQLLVLTIVIFVITSSQQYKTVRVFNLLSCLLFSVVSQVMLNYYKDRITGFEYLLMRYPNILINIIYLYRITKSIFLLTQVQASYTQ